MRETSFPKRRAFTLVELLVVIAIIALLITILLPSLNQAREQGKIAVCLANFRSLGTATQLYFNDNNEFFPLYTRVGRTKVPGVCSWAYGGKTNHEDWFIRQGGTHYIPASERPLNPYIAGAPVADGDEVPSLRCPGDRNSYQRSWSGVRGDDDWSYTGDYSDRPGFSSYDDVGTSYHSILESLKTEVPDPWDFRGTGWQKNLRELLHTPGVPDRMPWYMGDSMDWAYGTRQLIMGVHRKFSYHNVGFLDGHAKYMYVDTRARSGPNWLGLNPRWIVKDNYVPSTHYPASWTLDPPEDAR